jgi:mRNA interferase RelE/StbE
LPWTVEFDANAAKELRKLDPAIARRIVAFLRERVALLEDVRSIGEALRGDTLGEFWKYRLGDYRIVARIVDQRLVVIVVRIGHRREVYRR